MPAPDWIYRAEYVSTRSLRRPGDVDVRPEWVDEAFSDPAAVVVDPDFASRSGRSVRTIGWSVGAGFVVTVITVTEEGKTWGVDAWRSGAGDLARYRSVE